MKLFVLAALVVAASAGRLEHLERSYLPPDNNDQNVNHYGSGSGRFGASGHSSNGFGVNGFGSNSGSNGFGFNGRSSFDHSESHGSHGFGALSVSNSNGLSRNAAFGGAISNQYLPPNHGPSSSSNNAVPLFGSRNAFSTLGSISHGSHSNSQGSVAQPQFGAASRQYLAPKYKSAQQANPQQPFNEKSGYIY